METADCYRGFADREAWDVSPLYEEFALGVAKDADVLALLGTLPEPKRLPNLLFGAVKYRPGVLPDYRAFRAFVLGHKDQLRELMSSRSTQTNEPGRCAVLLPLLAASDGNVEIVVLGLVPEFVGRGFGGHLNCGNPTGLGDPPPRRGRDQEDLAPHLLQRSPKRLPNYGGRGFRAYKLERRHREVSGAP